MPNRKTVLVLVLGIAAANGYAANPPAVPSLHQITWLRINAFTDVPLAEGDVTVSDTAGRLLFEKHHATNSQGVYPAHVRALPRNFRVTVVWDGHNESNSERLLLGGFTLSTDIENFDPIHGIVHVNPVTTIVSRLLDRSHGGLTLQQAQDMVRRFLGLPSNASLGAAMREGKYFKSRYFSQKAFLTEAANYQGVEPFLQVLENELLAQPEKTHLFAGTPQSSSGGIGSWFAEKLAGAAVSWVGGQGCGWVAKQAGLTTPGATADDIAALQNGIAELQSSVDELSQQMQALEQQLSNKIDASDYRTTLTPALALAAQVDGVESDLAYFAQQCPALTDTSAPPDENTQRFCSNQKATVLGELNDLTIIHSYETLTTYVLDNPALLFNGMIHQFSLLIGENVRFFRPADSTKVQNTFDYWDYVLTQAANLKVELLHENGAQDVPGGVTQLTDFLGDASATPPKQGQFQNTHAAELKLMFPPVPVGTVVDTKYRNMWATGIPKLTVVELTDGSTISGCPAGFGGGPSDGWSGGPSFGTTWNGITGWASPTVTALQSLFDGWKGNAATPMSWLVTQTQAVAPDSPVSDGFFNILQCDSYYGYFVWTSTNQGSSNPNFYSPYAVVDLSNGQIPAKNTYPYGELNWLFLTRSFAQGEQYYWYP